LQKKTSKWLIIDEVRQKLTSSLLIFLICRQSQARISNQCFSRETSTLAL